MAVPDNTRIGGRPNFQADRTLWPVDTDSYSGSGDRGHLAPNYAIAVMGVKIDTFLMSNITPQRPNLNRQPGCV